MSMTTSRGQQTLPRQVASTVTEHPVGSGLSVLALLVLIGCGIMLLPDIIRYIRIKSM